MKQIFPRVQDEVLVADTRDNGKHAQVRVGSAQWFKWLDQAKTFTFAFADVGGQFTARKEQHAGNIYWYSYGSGGSRLRRAYLGKPADLTSERLHDAAKGWHRENGLHTAPASAIAAPLLTKLTIPPIRAAQLVPTHAFELMQQCDDFPLTLVSAPAGSGKTTLLAQWAATRCEPLAWVSLDADDASPARFWTYVLTALDPFVPGLLPLMLPKVQTPAPQLTDDDLAHLINLLATTAGSITLVLDDYHVLAEDAKIHEALAFIVGHLPANTHVILAGRSDPPLPLAQFRAHAQVKEVHATDLRFTASAATHFLKLAGITLAEHDVSTLDRRIEGWITGWQLVVPSLQRATDLRSWITSFNGGHRYIMDFLSEEVLKAVPAATVTFLLQTSVLTRLTTSLCDAVTESHQSKEMLFALRRANLFIESLDDQDHWFRYHPLFGEMLCNRLLQHSANEADALYQRASSWCEREGYSEEAIDYAIKGHDVSHAAAIIEAQSERVIADGELETLQRWLGRLPAENIRQRARLSMLQAYITMSYGQFEEVERAVQAAEAQIDQIDQTSQSLFQCELQTLRAALAAQQDKPHLCLALCRQALEALPPDHAFRLLLVLDIGLAYNLLGDVHKAGQKLDALRRQSELHHNTCYRALSSVHLARTRFLAGQLGESLALCRHVEAHFPAYDVSIDLSRVFYEIDDLTAALHYAKRSIDQHQTDRSAGMGYSMVANIYQAQGDASGANMMVESALAIAQEKDVRLTAFLQAQQAHLGLAQGNQALASRWTQAYGQRHESDVDANITLYERITLARFSLSHGKFHETLALLTPLQTEAEVSGRLGQVITIMVLQALAHEAVGNTQGASDMVKRALILGRPEGFVHAFVDCGPSLKNVLKRLQSEWSRPQKHAAPNENAEYIKRILQAFTGAEHGLALTPAAMNGHSKQRTAPQPLIEPLSSREIEVMQLLAEGASNQDLAQQLVIAVGTVKRHLSNIFLKLGVQSRTQAIARALSLQLIEM